MASARCSRTNRTRGIRLLATTCLLFSPASVAEDIGFGSPDAVPNQLKQDREGWGTFKEDLAERGLKFTIDYSAIGLGASDATPGAAAASSSAI